MWRGTLCRSLPGGGKLHNTLPSCHQPRQMCPATQQQQHACVCMCVCVLQPSLSHLIAQFVSDNRAAQILLGLTNHLARHLHCILLEQRQANDKPAAAAAAVSITPRAPSALPHTVEQQQAMMHGATAVGCGCGVCGRQCKSLLSGQVAHKPHD